MEPHETYAILTDSFFVPPQTIGLLASRALGVIRSSKYEISHELRYGGGIFFKGSERETAESLLSAFKSMGLSARIVSSAEIVPVEKPRFCTTMDAKEIYLQLGYRGTCEQIAWDEILLLACGAIRSKSYAARFLEKPEFKMMLGVKDRESREMLKASLLKKQEELVSPEGSMNKETKQEDEWANVPVYLDIVLQDLRRFRISRRDFSYGSLGEEIELSSKHNFHRVVERIARFSSPDSLSETGKAFLDQKGEFSWDFAFENENEFTLYVQWKCLSMASRP